MRYPASCFSLSSIPFFVLILLLFTFGCDSGGGGGGGFEPVQPTEGLNRLNVEITDAFINSQPVVTFLLTDDMGAPLDPADVRIRFVIARIPAGATEFISYITSVQTSPITGSSAVQASSEDSGDGTIVDLGGGLIQYTFNFDLPDDIDRSATHRVGIYADTTIGGEQWVSNDTFDFAPNGGGVGSVRDVVRTQTCNSCHDPLAIHGGFRRDTRLCIMCHTTTIIDPTTGAEVPQVDPDTGNNIGLQIMAHKIHMGAELPSVQAGTPYRIIGFRQSVHDYSTVEFPQNIKNCTKCHTGATQSDNYKNNPSRAACGACHDNVGFATATNHPVVQLDDNNCSGCHIPDSGNEFDISVVGAHTVELRASTLPGLNFDILDVVSAETGLSTVAPGEHAEVTYSMRTDSGDIVEPMDMGILAMTIAGPTREYNIQDYNGDGVRTPGAENVLRENIAAGSTGPDASGNFTYTFGGMIPLDANGTFAVGIEGRIERTVGGANKILVEEVEEAGRNDVFYFPVTGSVIERRVVVDNSVASDLCSSCHGQFSKDFSVHGNLRNSTEYCVLCHQPSADDIPFRSPAVGATEFTTAIDFKNMIHKIHTGEELTMQPYIIIGFFGSVNDFGEVLFPGDRKDCGACHLPGTNLLQAGTGVLGPAVRSTTEREILGTPTGVSVIGTFTTSPVISVCTSCHDNVVVTAAGDALTGENHAGGAVAEEACIGCHGVGGPISVEDEHFPALPPADRITRPN